MDLVRTGQIKLKRDAPLRVALPRAHRACEVPRLERLTVIALIRRAPTGERRTTGASARHQRLEENSAPERRPHEVQLLRFGAAPAPKVGEHHRAVVAAKSSRTAVPSGLLETGRHIELP